MLVLRGGLPRLPAQGPGAHARQLRHLPARLEGPRASRSRASTPPHVKEGGGGWIRPVIVEDGVVVGGWRSSRKGGRLEITLNLPRRERERLGPKIDAEIADIARFEGLPVRDFVKGYREPMIGNGRTLVAPVIVVAVALLSSCLGPVDRAHAQVPCVGDTSTAGLPKLRPPAPLRHHPRRARRARWGPPVPPVPDDPAEDAGRARAAAAAAPAVRPAPQPLLLVRRRGGLPALPRPHPPLHTRGYLVELQLRYHPDARAGGATSARWAALRPPGRRPLRPQPARGRASR